MESPVAPEKPPSKNSSNASRELNCTTQTDSNDYTKKLHLDFIKNWRTTINSIYNNIISYFDNKQINDISNINTTFDKLKENVIKDSDKLLLEFLQNIREWECLKKVYNSNEQIIKQIINNMNKIVNENRKHLEEIIQLTYRNNLGKSQKIAKLKEEYKIITSEQDGLKNEHLIKFKAEKNLLDNEISEQRKALEKRIKAKLDNFEQKMIKSWENITEKAKTADNFKKNIEDEIIKNKKLADKTRTIQRELVNILYKKTSDTLLNLQSTNMKSKQAKSSRTKTASGNLVLAKKKPATRSGIKFREQLHEETETDPIQGPEPVQGQVQGQVLEPEPVQGPEPVKEKHGLFSILKGRFKGRLKGIFPKTKKNNKLK
jgi:hypothetical protein